MTRIFLSLGSNVEPERNLRLAVEELSARLGPLRLSPVYRNEAVGFSGEDFLNLVAECDTELPVDAIVDAIETIHALSGRERGDTKFSSRPLDIDLLLFGDTIAAEPVRLPRPDVLRYSFALKPLVDLAPDAVHPETGRSFSAHWKDMQPDAHPLHRVPLSLDIATS